MTQQTRDVFAIPDIVTGYPVFENCFSVIEPEATVNLCTNPSFETGTAGHAALNGSIARDATWQRRGTYSCKITPTSGLEAGDYYAMNCTAGQPYAFSVDFKGEDGKWYNLYVADASNNRLSFKQRVKGNGYSQRIGVIYYEATGATRRFFFTRDAYNDTNSFFTDGWQIENKDHVTTYADGDMQGFLRNQTDFGWNGVPHASASWRSGQTKAGGLEMNLKDLGLTILSVIGLGVGTLGNIATPAVDGGSFYQGSVHKDRQFTIAANIAYTNLPDLMRSRKAIQAAFDVFNTANRQPSLLRYLPLDECGNQIGDKVEIRCLYSTGLEGQYDNDYAENVGITFQSFMPLIMSEGEKAAVLGYQTTVANANYILMRDPNGIWKAMGSSALNGTVRAMVVGLDGYLYVGGHFTTADGGTANYVAKWDGSAWSALGTGMDSDVYALAVLPSGYIVAGGNFTHADGGAANYVAMWNGSAWVPMGSGMNGLVRALAVGNDGTVYAGGAFTTAGGGAASRIAAWNGSVWAALGAGCSSDVRALLVNKSGVLFVGGDFGTAGGVTVNSIASYTPSTAIWAALGSGMNAGVESLALGPDNNLYAGGAFTTAGGVYVYYVAKWNGASWLPLNGPLNIGVSPGDVRSLMVDTNNYLWAGGDFSYAGGYLMPDSVALWLGSSWAPADVNLPGATNVYALAQGRDGSIYVGFTTSGSAVSATVTVPNVEGATAYPIFYITGPGNIWMIKNYTTGQAIYFNNLSLMGGETAILDLNPDNIRFVSNYRGNIRDSIIRGSSLDLALLPGNNNLSAYIWGSTSASTAISVSWHPAYTSIASAVQ